MTTRKILFSIGAAALSLTFFVVCAPRLINLEPSLPNRINIKTPPERGGWGDKDTLIWIVEGDSVEVQSVIYGRTRSDVQSLPVHFYDVQTVEDDLIMALIDSQIASLLGIQDRKTSIPWTVPVHSPEEKDTIYAHGQNYKQHILYGLVDPYDRIDELSEANNVASTRVNILWAPKVEITSSVRSTVRLIDSVTVKVESPIIPILFFDPGSAEIRSRPDTKRMLQEIAERLARNPAATLVLRGYIDVETDFGDTSLAEARAQAVKDTLLRLTSTEKGSVRVASADTYDFTAPIWPRTAAGLNEMQEENRRVEMEIEISGSSRVNGKMADELLDDENKDEMNWLMELLGKNRDIVLVLEKPYRPKTPPARLEIRLWEFQHDGRLSLETEGPWPIAENTEVDSMLREWEQLELEALRKIDPQRRRMFLALLDVPEISHRLYVRTYPDSTLGQPVRMRISGEPILYEPIKARYQFQIISEDTGQTTFKVLSSAGTRDLHLNLLNMKGDTVMTFGQYGVLFEYPDTLYTVSTTWIWNIGSPDSSRIEVEIDNGQDLLHREIIWDWNRLDVNSPDNRILDLEVALTDSAGQEVTDTIERFLTIEIDTVTVELHDVHIIVHCVFDQDNPLSSYLELRTQYLAKILVEDVNREKLRAVDISGHTCNVGTPQRNQRLSILRTVRTLRNFKNYLKLIKGFGTDEELSEWLGCEITQSPWCDRWPYGLRWLGVGPTNDLKEIARWNQTPEQRVANRRAEIEFFKRLR